MHFKNNRQPNINALYTQQCSAQPSEAHQNMSSVLLLAQHMGKMPACVLPGLQTSPQK